MSNTPMQTTIKTWTRLVRYKEIGLNLHLASDALRLVDEEELAMLPFSDPFWGFVWPGSYGLAKFITKNKNIVNKRNTIDFGTGCGLSALVARSCGGNVVANDTDLWALEVVEMSRKENGIAPILYSTENLIGMSEMDIKNSLFDGGNETLTILAGDMFYDTKLGADVNDWLTTLKNEGAEIYVGDPGRHALPPTLTHVGTYELPSWLRDDNAGVTDTKVFKM